MRPVVIGLGGLALGLAVAGQVIAQSRVVVPIIIQRPAGTSGATEVRVYGRGSGTPTGTPAAPVPGNGFATSPSSTQEIRVLRPGAPAPGYFTSPQTTQEIRIITPGGGAAADPGPVRSYHTSPTQSHEIRIQGGGAEVSTPVVIVPE